MSRISNFLSVNKIRKWKVFTNRKTNKIGLEYLPDLVLSQIFSFLTQQDINNIRLVSTRLSGAVLKIDKRFKTWKIVFNSNPFRRAQTLKDLQYDISKVFDYNIKIEVVLDKIYCDIYQEVSAWMIKYSSCINGLSVYSKDTYDKTRRMKEPILQLKQLKKLELHHVSCFTTDRLLSSIGPQLEYLTVNEEVFMRRSRHSPDPKEFFFRDINLSCVKHVKISSEFIFNFLTALPATLESLDLDSKYIEFPAAMKSLNNLTSLRIRSHQVDSPMLPAQLISTSLTRLYLHGIDVYSLYSLDTDLPSMKILGLCNYDIDMAVLKNLLIKCSKSLNMLYLSFIEIIEYEDDESLDISLLELTTLGLENIAHATLLPQLISTCHGSVTTLHCREVNLSCLDQLLMHDLPVLNVLSICGGGDPQFDVNSLLRKCSSSLEILHMSECGKVKFEVNVPNLKEIYFCWTDVDGFTKLVSPQGSKLETIGLFFNNGSMFDDIVSWCFPILKVVYLYGFCEFEKIEKSSIPDNVKLIKDHEIYQEWNRLQFRQYQCDKFKQFIEYMFE